MDNTTAEIMDLPVKFRPFNFLSNKNNKRAATAIQIAKLRKNISQASTGGQSLPIGGTGYEKILKGKPPVAIGKSNEFSLTTPGNFR